MTVSIRSICPLLKKKKIRKLLSISNKRENFPLISYLQLSHGWTIVLDIDTPTRSRAISAEQSLFLSSTVVSLLLALWWMSRSLNISSRTGVINHSESLCYGLRLRQRGGCACHNHDFGTDGICIIRRFWVCF